MGRWLAATVLVGSCVLVTLPARGQSDPPPPADEPETVYRAEEIVVEEKASLMRKLGKKQLTLHLQEPLATVPAGLAEWRLTLKNGGCDLEYSFDAREEHTGIPALLRRMGELGIGFRDLNTEQSSLEDIFVDLVSERR